MSKPLNLFFVLSIVFHVVFLYRLNQIPESIRTVAVPKIKGNPIVVSLQGDRLEYDEQEISQIAKTAMLKNQKPIYPQLSLRLKQEGTGIVEVFVSEEGFVEELEFKKSTGFLRLDQQIKDAVKSWTIPNPKGVSFWMTLPLFHFKLAKQK